MLPIGWKFGQIIASKDELIELVEIIETAACWEGEYGSTKREMMLEEQARLLKQEIARR